MRPVKTGDIKPGTSIYLSNLSSHFLIGLGVWGALPLGANHIRNLWESRLSVKSYPRCQICPIKTSAAVGV